MSFDLFECTTDCGCAAKIPPNMLKGLLDDLDIIDDPNVIINFDDLDDAGIYRLDKEELMVQTVDFFPPVARDPYTYGQIAAANSLSDIYAMGGIPKTALAILCYPAKDLDIAILKEIKRGAVNKLNEAKTSLLGGHSIIDKQIKYGFSVTGFIKEKMLMDNAHAQAGDLLVLSKPLGTGVTIMALKANMVSKTDEQILYNYMASLNDKAAKIATDFQLKTATDVTGFGLLGHAYQMAKASNVSMKIEVNKIAKLANIIQYAEMGMLSAAAYANRKYLKEDVKICSDLTLAEQDIMFDPQTSGGLLMACPKEKITDFISRCQAELDTPCTIIGEVISQENNKSSVYI